MSKYSIHPNYDERSNVFDFAILKLINPVLIDYRAVPVCLPPTSWGKEFLVGKKLTISGWGSISEAGSSSNVLQSTNVPGISNSECKNLYENRIPIIDQMICAGDVEKGGADACRGDGGGNVNIFVIHINPSNINLLSIVTSYIHSYQMRNIYEFF